MKATADSKTTRKFRVYRHLYHVNKAFHYLDHNLEMLLTNDLLPRDNTEVWRNRLGEIQAEINMPLTGYLHQQEFGQIQRFAPLIEEWEENQIAKATAKSIKKKSARKKR
ncbi:MAG TPA: hypothetical protein VNW97_12800 [Candidatus Saccharimonadales bacterium]|jgi:hypothetical protein|nr:hypothetical protein [Candidatus Saccharimonadales bacterium]